MKREDWQDRIQRTRFGKLMLRQPMFRQMNNDEGVTLIELMAVVVILGIIAAVAIPVVTSAITQAKVNTTETNLGTLQQALERYAADHGRYPATLSVLDEQTNSQGLTNSSGQQFGPYLTTAFPEQDSWGHHIWYAPVPTSTNPTGYYLFSGEGNPVFGAGATSGTGSKLSTTANYIYAAGGLDSSGTVIAASPTPTTPTTFSSGKGPLSSALSYYDQ